MTLTFGGEGRASTSDVVLSTSEVVTFISEVVKAQSRKRALVRTRALLHEVLVFILHSFTMVSNFPKNKPLRVKDFKEKILHP